MRRLPRVDSYLVILLSGLFFFALLCLKHRKLIQKVYLYNAAALRPNIHRFSKDFQHTYIHFLHTCRYRYQLTLSVQRLDPQIPVLFACRYRYLLTSSVQRLDQQIPVLHTCRYRYLLTSSVQSLDPQIPVLRTYL